MGGGGGGGGGGWEGEGNYFRQTLLPVKYRDQLNTLYSNGPLGNLFPNIYKFGKLQIFIFSWF